MIDNKILELFDNVDNYDADYLCKKIKPFAKEVKIIAVIGDPINHSLSPLLQNFLIKKNSLHAYYIPLLVKSADLAKTINLMKECHFAGFNITIPHKESCMKSVDSISSSAKIIGAINTAEIKNNKINGDNSDWQGFLEGIKSQINYNNLKRNKAFVLGAGGSSRAILYALIKENFKKITIANRNLERALELKEIFTKAGQSIIEVIEWEDKENGLKNTDLLVNTTSCGMNGQNILNLDLKYLPKHAVVTDIIYNPLITDFLKKSQENGNQIAVGSNMLIYQGLIGFKKWFGFNPKKTDIQMAIKLVEKQLLS